MNWRNRCRRLFGSESEPEGALQPQMLLLVGRDPTTAEVAEFRTVIRGDTGAIVKDNVSNVLVDVRVSGSSDGPKRNA